MTNIDWIDEKYLENVLESYENEEIEVKNFVVNLGSGKGDNFASALFRISVDYAIKGEDDEKNISLILKTDLDDPLISEIVKEFHIFEREKWVYKNILVGINLILNSIGDCTVFSPKLVYEDAKALILEDLLIKGFRLCNRKLRLDLNHAKLLMEKIAKFHAASAVLSKNNIDLFQYHLYGSIGYKENPIHAFYQNSGDAVASAVEEDPDLAQFGSAIRDFADNIISKAQKIYTRDENSFNVLNHGDLWINNLLWKYDDNGNVADVLMVDHQEGFYGSPGIDVNHFIYTSCNTDVQANHIDELVELYHDQLQLSLQQLNYCEKIPSLDDIKREMKDKNDHAILVVVANLPVMLIENTDDANAENFILNTEEAKRVRREVFSNPKYLDSLKMILPKLINI